VTRKKFAVCVIVAVMCGALSTLLPPPKKSRATTRPSGDEVRRLAEWNLLFNH